jgi:hypothetical protein
MVPYYPLGIATEADSALGATSSTGGFTSPFDPVFHDLFAPVALADSSTIDLELAYELF